MSNIRFCLSDPILFFSVPPEYDQDGNVQQTT